MSDRFEAWAVVELFGHQVIAGLVSEQEVGGQSFVRVDVPSVETPSGPTDAFTKLYGSGAIYAVSPCSEELVRAHIRQHRPKPIHLYLPELHATPALRSGFDDDDS